ncbi:MAG: adenylyltransferase/cytidyltransferase family protein [Polaromonas sp.]|nr:adenylyltransferase/cytidyltransferase family protein [Polaromonas sp.]
MTSIPKKHDVSIYIGRFQIFHNGQLALLRRALEAAPLCIVVLGSAWQARTPKNPFTWQERAEMIRLALPEADRDRVHFLPVRDYYDQERWVSAVKHGVVKLAGEKSGTLPVLVGHFKDATSEYLKNFPGWTLDAVESQGRIDASALRDAYFGNAGAALEPALAALVSQAPASTIAFLRTWAALPYFHELAQEWESLRKEKAKWAGSPYAPVFVTVDAVVKCSGRVEEETGMRLLEGDMKNALKAVHVFDHPDRSLRGRVITHAHFFDLGSRQLPEVQAADDAADAEWIPVDQLAAMEDRFHDDHFHMLDFFFALTERI